MARGNARLNRAVALIEIIRAKGLSDRRIQARAPFDLVFANILLGPLKQLANPIRRIAAPGARVVVSGLLLGLAGAALLLERRVLRDGWVTLIQVCPTMRTACGGRRHYRA